jgi:hypothetical protein
MLRTKTQNSRLHALITKLGIDDEAKEELVYNFTGTREKSTSRMEVSECQNLINYLQAVANNGNGNITASGKPLPESLRTGANAASDKMRKKILSICHEMNWKLDNGKINWNSLNDYLLKYGYLHKLLDDYKEAELPTLVTQFENLLKAFYKKL